MVSWRVGGTGKGMFAPGIMFEELGWNYIGPIDGHDLPTLLTTLRNMRELEGPQFLHVVTKKGKGFAPAEQEPIVYHAMTKKASVPSKPAGPRYSAVFGQWLCDMAAHDERLLGITPAMKTNYVCCSIPVITMLVQQRCVTRAVAARMLRSVQV